MSTRLWEIVPQMVAHRDLTVPVRCRTIREFVQQDVRGRVVSTEPLDHPVYRVEIRKLDWPRNHSCPVEFSQDLFSAGQNYGLDTDTAEALLESWLLDSDGQPDTELISEVLSLLVLTAEKNTRELQPDTELIAEVFSLMVLIAENNTRERLSA